MIWGRFQWAKKAFIETVEYIFTLGTPIKNKKNIIKYNKIKIRKGFYQGSGVSFYIRHPNKARPCTSGNGRAVSGLARPPGYIHLSKLRNGFRMSFVSLYWIIKLLNWKFKERLERKRTVCCSQQLFPLGSAEKILTKQKHESWNSRLTKNISQIPKHFPVPKHFPRYEEMDECNGKIASVALQENTEKNYVFKVCVVLQKLM